VRDQIFSTKCPWCNPRNPVFRATDWHTSSIGGPGHTCEWQAGAVLNDELPQLLQGTEMSPRDFCYTACAFSNDCVGYETSPTRCILFNSDPVARPASHPAQECFAMHPVKVGPRLPSQADLLAQRTYPGTFFIGLLDKNEGAQQEGCPPRGTYGALVQDAIDILQAAKPELGVPSMPDHVVVPCCGEFTTTREAIRQWPVYIWEALLMWISHVPIEALVSRLVCKSKSQKGTPCGTDLGNGKIFDGEGYNKAVAMELIFPLLLSHKEIKKDAKGASIFVDKDVCLFYGNSSTIASFCGPEPDSATAAERCLWTRSKFKTDKC